MVDGRVLRFSILSFIIVVGVLGFVSSVTFADVFINPLYPNTDNNFVYVYATIGEEGADIDYTTLYYKINGGEVSTQEFSGPLSDGEAAIFYNNPANGARVDYQIKSVDNLGDEFFYPSETTWETYYYDGSAPIVSVNGAPSNILVTQTGVSASVECEDEINECIVEKLYVSNTEIVDCSIMNIEDYDDSPQTITEHSWVCAYAEDNAENFAFSEPVEFKVFNTIQSAINFANSVDTINVNAGTYSERLNLLGKSLTILGAGSSSTIIDASSFIDNGYAIYNFGSDSTIKDLKLIGVSGTGNAKYGFKISHVNNILLENIEVENSYKTGIDLNTINGATLNNIKVTNTQSGFGLMILDSNNIIVTDVMTSENAWGGVSVQTINAISDNIQFLDNFDVAEGYLLLEKDPPTYYELTNVQIPNKFNYVIYGFRTADNYQQWFYFETLSEAKTFAGSLTSSHSDLIIYNLAENNYYVIEGMKIQDSIDVATEGDTINVDEGDYTTTGQVVINKDLTIIGDELKPTISPDNDLPKTNNVAGAWFLINSEIEFNLENFVLDGNGFSVYQGIRSHGNTNIENVDFLNIKDDTSPYVGFAVANFGGTIPAGAGADTHISGGTTSTLTITDCTFSQIGRIGVLVKGTESNANIMNNIYTGKGEGNFLDYAFEAGAGGNIVATNNIISNNKGIASTDGSTSAGILVTDYFGTGTQATLNYNTITDSTTAIAVGFDEKDESMVTANFNKFLNNDYGIESTNPLVNAENNWWGFNIPNSISQLISGNVDYIPWAYADGLYDNQYPITTINSPDILSLQKSDFVVSFTDTEVGDAGLQFCKYRVRSWNAITEEWDISKSLGLRDYSQPVTLTVGIGADCRTEGIGVCKVETYCMDNSGNNNSDILLIERTFSIDFTAPELTIISPETDGESIDAVSLYLVEAEVNDDSSGIESVKLNLTKDGILILEDIPMSEGTLYYEYLINMWNLESGTYTLEITATDEAGNSVTQLRTFTIEDNVAPSKITTVAGSVSAETGGTVSFRFNVTARGAGEIKFGMDDIAGLSPSALNARISEDEIIFADVGEFDGTNIVGAETLTLTDLNTAVSNVQGSFVFYLDIPANMSLGTYSIHYYIDN